MRSLRKAIWARPYSYGFAALAIALLLGFLAPHRARAAEAAPAKPCDTAPYHQFDFWLGDWRVYDGTNGQLVAKDHIETQFQGCVVQQTLTFVTDMYRKPGVAYRLAGASTSRFDGQQWLQLWVDNQWGAIIMKGAPTKDGDMVLDTAIPSRGRDVRLIWKREPGGVVRILQYVADTGSGKWEQYGDLIYRREAGSAASPQASSGAATP
jgi:hypothetical protein